jgi:hypothetical protein
LKEEIYKILTFFEKSIVGLLLGLFVICFAIDHYSPLIFYPELNRVSDDPAVLVNPAPRKGQVVPVSEYSVYLSDPSVFLARDEFAKKSGDSRYDATKINWFSKASDGKKYPSNAYLLGFSPFHTSKYWLPLLAVNLRVRYMRDDVIKVGDDTWQTAPETYVRMWGDCEDHAIFLADWLIGSGHDARVVAGTVKGEAHAWVVLYKDGKEYLLESTDKASRRRYPLVSLHPEYEPVFMFNRDHFWAVITENEDRRNRIAAKSWLVLSDFKEEK